MSDGKQTLSEISHLFLSGVRESTGASMPRPVRVPPPKMNVSIDMTPEEFAAAEGGQASQSRDGGRIGGVSVLVASHFGEGCVEAAKAYAKHLSATCSQRVGIIEIDASIMRLYSVEKQIGSSSDMEGGPAAFEADQLAGALEEMNWDIDRWLVLLPDVRSPEARGILRQGGHWVLLCDAGHEGMVAAYRTFKGIADGYKPRLSIAAVGEKSAAERIGKKLGGVCEQFLGWTAQECVVVRDAGGYEAHAVVEWKPSRDKSQLAAGTHWKAVSDFMSRAKAHVVEEAPVLSAAESEFVSQREEVAEAAVASVSPVIGVIRPEAKAVSNSEEVIELSDDEPAAILGAILKHNAGDWVEAPVCAPMCPEARLAVSRDRRLTLIAVAGQGLGDLRAIGRAYRWVTENRSLICMAVPQLAIDAHALPGLRLIINHADLSADILQPLLESSAVTVQSYRTLRWGQKTGLLLEAA